jgi:hypothetical protein
MNNLFSTPIRRIVLGVGATVILVGAAVGIAAAQQSPAPATGTATSQQQRPTFQAFLDALAKRLNITTDQLNQAISGARTDVGLPANGGFPGRGPGGFAFGRGGFELNAAAQAIGITVDQLRSELPGKSLSQVAQAHGRNPNDVATALKNALHQRIDQAVAAGRLTADQGNQAKQQGDQRIDQRVTQVVPQGGFPGRGRGPRGGDEPSGNS